MAKQRNPNGMGSYRQKNDGRYEWRQTIDGKERSLTAKSMKELQQKVKRVIDLAVTKDDCRVDEWFEKWLETYIKPLKKKATYDQYLNIYKSHINPIIGHRKMANLKQYDAQYVIAKMNENGMSSKTMKHAKTVMNGGFKRAVDEKMIPKNPAEKIEIPVKQAKPRKTLSVSELNKIFTAMAGSRWIWSVKFMLVTGMRRGEILALKWTDIDFENKRITVDESDSSTGLGDTKSSKVHYVPLSDMAVGYLAEQQKMLKNEYNPITVQKDTLTQFENLDNKELLVFPTEKGEMIRPNTYYNVIHRFAAKAGIKASPHCLRHTFVFMSRETLSLKEIQNILGHDESTTTLDIYGDILSETTDKTAAQIDSIFSKVEEEATKIQNKKLAKVIQLRKIK